MQAKIKVHMTLFTLLAQIIVATSVAYVWIFRHDNIIAEFKQFGLSDVARCFIGAIKIALATLIIVGIWYPSLIPVPAAIMGLLMIAAQYFHFKVKNPFIKHVPSLLLLVLCVFLIVTSPHII